MLSTEMQSYVNNEKLYREKASKVYNYTIDKRGVLERQVLLSLLKKGFANG